MRHGFNAAALHGDMDQSARTAALDGFRKGEAKLLIASDVAARGLDIPDVSHVFNFDVPHHADDYVHRIGRTGRAGKTGTAITIVAPADSKSVAAIEKLIGQSIAWAGEPPRRRGSRTPASARAAAPRRDGRGRAAAARHRARRPPPRESRAPSARAPAPPRPEHRPRARSWPASRSARRARLRTGRAIASRAELAGRLAPAGIPAAARPRQGLDRSALRSLTWRLRSPSPAFEYRLWPVRGTTPPGLRFAKSG